MHDNGQAGITTISAHLMLVENNEIAYNNYAGYDSHYDGGGTKFMKSLNLTLRGNYAHHNYGIGLWFDWDNKGILAENNTLEDNDGPGIFHEAGYDAVIRNNTVRRNGFNFHSGWIDGSGILLLASNNTEIYGNRVEKNKEGIGLTQTDRGSGAYGPHETHDVNVHDNTISTVAPSPPASSNPATTPATTPAATSASTTTPTHLPHRLLGLDQRHPRLPQPKPMDRRRQRHHRHLHHRLLRIPTLTIGLSADESGCS